MNKFNIAISNSKKLFLTHIEDHGEDPWSLKIHIEEAIKWADKLLKKYPKLDRNVIFLSIWLHDVGHYPVTKEDHAVKSEKIAKEFLTKQKVDAGTINQVLHCIRSYRNKDVKPKTAEAKFFAALDSISHFTYAPYIDMARDGRGKAAEEKLERDYRDLKPFPELKIELTPLYKAWKKLLKEINKQDLY